MESDDKRGPEARDAIDYTSDAANRDRDLEIDDNPKPTSNSDWCFVATAVYGDIDAWQVRILR